MHSLRVCGAAEVGSVDGEDRVSDPESAAPGGGQAFIDLRDEHREAVIHAALRDNHRPYQLSLWMIEALFEYTKTYEYDTGF